MSDGELGNELGDRFAPDVADALERRDELLRRDVGRIAVHADARGVAQEDLAEDPVQEGPRLVDGDAPRPGELERGREDRLPLERGVAAMRLLEAGDEPRHRDRPGADPECLRARVLEVDDHLLELAQRLRRDGEEAVEDDRSLVGPGHEEKPAARGARQRPLDDGGDERRREAGVDRVPAGGEHVRSRLGRQRVTCGDRTAGNAVSSGRPRGHRESVLGSDAAYRRRAGSVLAQEARELGAVLRLGRGAALERHACRPPPGPAEAGRDDRHPHLAGEP